MARAGCSPEHPKYTAGCGDCNAIARREKELAAQRKSHGRGRTYVPIGDVAPHARKLRELGWRTLDIAREAHVSTSVVDELFRDQPRMGKIVSETATAVLSLPLIPRDDTDRPGLVDALGTSRRIRALATLGHSQKAQAVEAGLSWHQVMMIARGEIARVKKETADAIAIVYDRWSTIPGTETSGKGAWSIRREALARGWHDPLAWDRIDDPDCEPETYDDDVKRNADDVDWTNVGHALAGVSKWDELTYAERVIVVTRLVRRMPDVGIAQYLGTNTQAIGRLRTSKGIPAASAAVLDHWQQELLQRRRYVAPVGEVRRRYDLIEAA